MKIKFLLLNILILGLAACGSRNSRNENQGLDYILDEGTGNTNIEISPESMNSIIESIPSPIEIAMIIKQSGTDFNSNLLNPENNSSSYTTAHDKALALGIYSADLGYINIYEKSFLTINYLNAIKKLADDISIGQFFDFETIRRLASNSDKIDSLIFLSTVNFNRMDSYLRSQKRNNMSILMVSGTWIEGLYIACTSYKDIGNKDIMDWIGNQKKILDQLLLGLNAFKNDASFQLLINDLSGLKEIYNNIEITYEYHEPESAEVNGRLVIIDKSTSRVDITPDQISMIEEQVARIRTRFARNL